MPIWRCPSNTSHDIEAPKALPNDDKRRICVLCTNIHPKRIIFRRLDWSTVQRRKLTEDVQRKREEYATMMLGLFRAAETVCNNLTDPVTVVASTAMNEYAIASAKKTGSSYYNRFYNLSPKHHPLLHLARVFAGCDLAGRPVLPLATIPAALHAAMPEVFTVESARLATAEMRLSGERWDALLTHISSAIAAHKAAKKSTRTKAKSGV